MFPLCCGLVVVWMLCSGLVEGSRDFGLKKVGGGKIQLILPF